MKSEQKSTSEKLIVLDMIGTLTDEIHIVSKYLNELLEGHDRRKIREYYELYKIDQVSRGLFWKQFGVDNIDEYEKRFLNRINFRAEMPDVLSSLKKNYRMAILSNIPKEWGRYLAKEGEFNKYFEQIIFSGECGLKKPDPKIYKHLLSKFPHIATSDIFYIDDDLGDLEPSSKFGINTIWLTVEESEVDYQPDYTIDTLGEIEAILPDLTK
jgi:putative hydrolase of the HAD superfamily